jgi:nucleoside-diphosphate-sugar epimerase
MTQAKFLITGATGYTAGYTVRQLLEKNQAVRVLAHLKTLRFLVINRAARLARISGRKVLRLSSNPATETLYDQILNRLAA